MSFFFPGSSSLSLTGEFEEIHYREDSFISYNIYFIFEMHFCPSLSAFSSWEIRLVGVSVIVTSFSKLPLPSHCPLRLSQ